jgi:hypothetical protein
MQALTDWRARFAARSETLGRVALLAAVFFAGGVLVPHIADADSSAGGSIFEPLPPARILDTRFGPSPLPVGTPLAPGQTIEVQVLGEGGVLLDATAVALNVTATEATAASYLTVFPAGTEPPLASNLNFGPGDTIPNAVVAKIGANGKVAIRNNAGSVHVVADVNGFYRGHNHDDRYDTKEQVDAKIDTAQAETGYVGANQIAANAVTSGKVADSSLVMRDLATSTTMTGIAINLADGACRGLIVNTPNGDRVMVFPQRLAGVAGSASFTLNPSMANVNGTATIEVCNYSGGALNLSGMSLTYWVLEI